MRRLELELVLCVALAAACGGLDSPDLGTGTVRGRIVGHLDGAYAYPMNRPDLKVPVLADDTFTLQEVPVETHEIVLVDGPNGGIWRAVRAPVAVQGSGETTIADRYGDAAAVDPAEKMPFAGAVVAFAQCEGGATTSSQRFTTLGTDQVDVSAGTTGAAVMAPLPPGDAVIRAHVDGFFDADAAVTIVSASSTYVAIPLAIDTNLTAPGCAASGGCLNGLLCAADGACYECRGDSDCGAGSTCDPVLHTCSSLLANSGAICDSCSTDTDCNVALGYACVSADTAKYCTRTGCTSDLGCPAGFSCDTGHICRPPGSCAAYQTALGAPCWDAGLCTSILNSSAVCEGVNLGLSVPQPGYCTAPCQPTRADDCSVVDGFACTLDGAGPGYVCQRPL